MTLGPHAVCWMQIKLGVRYDVVGELGMDTDND